MLEEDEVAAMEDDEATDGTEESTDLEEPVEVEEPEVEAPSAPWSKLPGWAIGAVTFLALAGFAWAISNGWDYIVSKDETAEKEDWEQLLGLIDRVDTLVLFVLGAVFGVAVQAGQTVNAKRVADKNKREATKQHSKAERNERAARKNQRAARDQAKLADEAIARVREARRVIDDVGRDGRTLSLEGSDLRQFNIVSGERRRAALDAEGVGPADVEVGAIDPRLEVLARELDDFATRAEKRRLS